MATLIPSEAKSDETTGHSKSRTGAALVILSVTLASICSADVRLPRYYPRAMLPNGVVLYMMPRPGVPLVDFRIAVKGGIESEVEPVLRATWHPSRLSLLRRGTTHAAQRISFQDELDEPRRPVCQQYQQ